MKQRVYSFTNARFVIYINLYYIEKSYYSYFKVTVLTPQFHSKRPNIYSRTHGRIKIKFKYKVKVNLKVTGLLGIF